MEIDRHLKRIQKTFFEYDLTDSIIENMSFDSSLVNFNMTVDYYFTDREEEHIRVIFKNCSEVNYDIPLEIYDLNNGGLNFSHFTIIKTAVSKVGNQICIKVFTVNDEREFLKILCQDVGLERL